MGWENDIVGISGGVVRELDKILRREVDLMGLNARITANRVARANAQSGDRKSLDGLGQMRMLVPNESYHYWGQRLGYECWKDKQFLREFERDNPEVRVKSRGTKIQSGYQGKPPHPNPLPQGGEGREQRQVRFTKTYA